MKTTSFWQLELFSACYESNRSTPKLANFWSFRIDERALYLFGQQALRIAPFVASSRCADARVATFRQRDYRVTSQRSALFFVCCCFVAQFCDRKTLRPSGRSLLNRRPRVIVLPTMSHCGGLSLSETREGQNSAVAEHQGIVT
jgi:hypothetical protein